MKVICPDCGCADGKHNRYCRGGAENVQRIVTGMKRGVTKVKRPVTETTRSVTDVPPVVTERNEPIISTTRVTDSTVHEAMVPCACGCGQLVKARPVYFSPACRVRAYRRGK